MTSKTALAAAPAERDVNNASSTNALKKLTVEELMGLEITSVSRSEETLSGAAAAITVVTNEDIRRSGATTVPEALRLVPGIHVARQDSNTWAVSARGFSSANSEKLLVLSDTRSIYTPLYSGVFWNAQDYLLEDIERIEVVRGPGASLWGSNAVNGVININTKNARDTQGAYLSALAGSEERITIGARYGASTEGGVYYRVFGQHFDRDSSFNALSDRSDDWRMTHLGFRADWDANERDAFTLQGDVYRGDISQRQPSVVVNGRQGPQGTLRIGASGGNVLGRWRRTLDEDADLQLRVYYDRTHRNDPSFVDDLDTADVDFQHRFALTADQELIWGLNYRYTSNRNEGKGLFALQPSSSVDQLFSGFVQDQISFADAWRVTVGTKLEHNDFSGFEVQPSIRAAWDFRPAHTLWSAVSRAVRVPTRLERDIAIDASDPAGDPVVRLLGNEDFDSEELLAYELGYRWQALTTLSFDVAAFHNRYHGLSSLEFGDSFVDATGRTILPIMNRNLTDGVAQGVEAAATFAPLEAWRLSASYSNVDLSLSLHGQDLNRGRFMEGATPRHQLGLRSLFDLGADVEIDTQLRYLSAIRTLPGSGERIPGYTEMDLRLAWQASEQLELSLVGQNLLHEQHAEFGSPAARGEIERSAYGKLSWTF